MLPLFVSWTITEVCVTSLLTLKNWGQKYYHTLGIRHYRHWIVDTIKKGNDRYLWSGVKTFTPCAVRIIIFKRESLNYLLASFTRCTLPFQCVCFLLPFCLPCVSCGTYCNAHKCYAVTHRAADIRVAWLVYVRTYCMPIAILNQNERTWLLYLGDAQITTALIV